MSSLNYSLHPLLNTNVGLPIGALPPQLLPLKEKGEEWQHSNMDALEQIGRHQYYENAKLLENYRMLNGEFIREHYEDVDENEYASLLEMAAEHFNKKLHLQHFDFISQAVNTLIGELEAHPNTFKAKAIGSNVISQIEEEKSRMLLEYVKASINKNIDLALQKQGLDPQKQDFQSQEEQQQYQQQLEEQRNILTPAEIQRYFSTKWQHVGERWSNIQLQNDRFQHRRDKLESIEFRDSLAVARCFRHFWITPTGYKEETWNPRDVFFHLSPDVTEIEKGNFVGRSFIRSLPDVIDIYGHKLTGKQLEELQGEFSAYAGSKYGKDWWGNAISYLSPEGVPYGVRLPTTNRDILDLIPDVAQTTTLNHPLLSSMPGRFASNYRYYINNLFQVTEAYWKSARRVGKLCWINPETELFEVVIIDETAILPDNVKEVEGNLATDVEFDGTPVVQWTWINEIWKGKKITPLAGSHKSRKPIYFDIGPLEFQGRPESEYADAELPVIGEIFNARNAEAQSLVDAIKPFQIMVNLFMNQARIIAEEEILPFVIMDNNAIPNIKDWSDKETGFEKWWASVRELHVAQLDTRPSNTLNANTGGQLPKVIDLDATQRMLTRIELAERFKVIGLSMVGLNPQRLAAIKPQETATGVETAMQQSYTQTASYFTRFYDYVQRCLQKGLDFAQYVQSRNLDITIASIHDDYSKELLRLTSTDLLMVQLKVFVSNAQEEQRNLQIAKQLALENNTVLTSMGDRLEMATSNSLQFIKDTLRESELKQEKQQQQAQQLEQQKLQQAAEEAEKQRAFDAEQNQLDRENRLEERYIQTFGYGNNASVDSDSSGTPDALEYDKLSQKSQSDSEKNQIQREKLMQDRLKIANDNQKHMDNIQLQRDKMKSDRELAEKKIQQARIQGDKSK